MISQNFLPNVLDGEDKSSILCNRIRKNYRHIRKWAKRTSTNCFRIYGKEIHQYPIVLDYYDGKFCAQYFARSRDEMHPPSDIQEELNKTIKTLFNIDEAYIFWRIRARSKATRQYEKADNSGNFFTVVEYGVKFRVNLQDYLDTGLFLDHRETRHLVAAHAKGKRVLNLFAYTCAFSVHAAAAGAAFTKSVDMSNTYIDWGRQNFLLNDFSLKNNVLVRADCLKFLDAEIKGGSTYDIIVIDPPTISRSKKMDQLFDIHEDYVELISKSLKLLNAGGTIFFSTNSRKFKFDTDLFKDCKICDISSKTIPLDFHDKSAHQCWTINLVRARDL